jgi:hypothetical protein
MKYTPGSPVRHAFWTIFSKTIAAFSVPTTAPERGLSSS